VAVAAAIADKREMDPRELAIKLKQTGKGSKHIVKKMVNILTEEINDRNETERNKALLLLLSFTALTSTYAINIAPTDLNATPAELAARYGKPVMIESSWFEAGDSLLQLPAQ
jgi:hypothetical protein